VGEPIPGQSEWERQNRGMHGTLTSGGASAEAVPAAIEQHLGAREFFWLDLDGVDDEAHDFFLDTLHIHHLAVDDMQHFGQRPKIEDYEGFTYMVVHGAGSDATSTQEVHFIFAEPFLVTVRVRPWNGCTSGSGTGARQTSSHPNWR
jgi:Mg2+ and Co2+ transporter CorA